MKRSFVSTAIAALAAAFITFMAPDNLLAQCGYSGCNGRATVSPTSQDFGQIPLGQSASLQFTVTNTGTDSLLWLAFPVTGMTGFPQVGMAVNSTNPNRYSSVYTQGSQDFWLQGINLYDSNGNYIGYIQPFLLPGESVTLTFSITPAAVGPISGTIRVSSSADQWPQPQIQFTGTVVASGSPASATYTLSSTVIDFGTMVPGQSVTGHSTVTNTSTATDLHVSGYSYKLLDSGRSDYLTSTDFPEINEVSGFQAFRPDGGSYTIPPGGQQTFAFTYTATGTFTSPNPKSGTIELNTDGAGPSGISFTALVQYSQNQNGRVAVSSSLNFGDIILGQTGTANLVVGNTGTGDLNLWMLEVQGASGFSGASVTGSTWSYGAMFSLDRTLLPGQNTTVSIQLTPVMLGPINGSLKLYTTDPTTIDNVVTIAFAGNVITQPTPVVATPAPPPEKPGISFSYESTVVGDSASVGLFLGWKVIWPNLASVTYDIIGNGQTIQVQGQNVRVMLLLGTYTIKVTAKDIRDDSIHVDSQTLIFAKPVVAAIAPTTPVAEQVAPTFTTGTVGSSIVKSEGLAGGGGKKRPKRQVVPAPPASKVAVTSQPVSWGAIKASFQE